MKRILSGLLAATSLLWGCAPQRRPLELVILPDISASIDTESRRQMFAAIEDVALNLHRGDTLTIIPITGDAEAELSGRILRCEFPTAAHRQAYDSDLRGIQTKLRSDLERLAAAAEAHPGRHTDILGSIRVAMNEFSSNSTDKRLIILSDFIQEDRQLNFSREHPPIGAETAKRLLPELTRAGLRSSLRVSLGRLRSVEFSSLPPIQQQAIDRFWEQLLPEAQRAPDGLQMLKRATTAQ